LRSFAWGSKSYAWLAIGIDWPEEVVVDHVVVGVSGALPVSTLVGVGMMFVTGSTVGDKWEGVGRFVEPGLSGPRISCEVKNTIRACRASSRLPIS
jgi:hypothetical protein